MTYVTTSEVYGTAGISSDEISEANVTNAIYAAEATVDRLTNTTYWAVEDSGTATSGGNTTLTDTGNFSDDSFIGMYCWIYGGTGSGQIREIASHDSDELTVSSAWTTNPDNTSTYRIIYANHDPYIDEELRDGDDTDTLFVDKYPLRLLESVTINDTSVTPSYIYQYKDTGKLVLGKSDCEANTWTSKKAQKNELAYWYGVYPIPWEVKRLTLVYASLFILQTQMGGTHNIPSTYSLPEGSLTIGQAYINIKGTWDTLMKEKSALEKIIVKYPSFA